MFEVTVKLKIVYELIYTKSTQLYDQRDGAYNGNKSVIVNFQSLEDLFNHYYLIKPDKTCFDFKACKKEVIDLTKPPKATRETPAECMYDPKDYGVDRGSGII